MNEKLSETNKYNLHDWIKNQRELLQLEKEANFFYLYKIIND